ncbi:MAG: VOC family protein [Verrucomicrobiota bacterium]
MSFLPHTMVTPFHIAVQVRNIPEARDFYGNKLGLEEGRSDEIWIDWNCFGHQVVTHLNPNLGPEGRVASHCNPVDSHAVPVPHFGVILTISRWEAFAERCRSVIDHFLIEPYVRFEGQPGEQRTMFFEDPSGNALEFKAFADIENQLFAK